MGFGKRHYVVIRSDSGVVPRSLQRRASLTGGLVPLQEGQFRE